MSDIREKATLEARKWADDDSVRGWITPEKGFIAGYLSGYEAARAEAARLREYVLRDAYCPCCGDNGKNHDPGCEHHDERIDDARIALWGTTGRDHD